jgi:hypothetical protein
VDVNGTPHHARAESIQRGPHDGRPRAFDLPLQKGKHASGREEKRQNNPAVDNPVHVEEKLEHYRRAAANLKLYLLTGPPDAAGGRRY